MKKVFRIYLIATTLAFAAAKNAQAQKDTVYLADHLHNPYDDYSRMVEYDSGQIKNAQSKMDQLIAAYPGPHKPEGIEKLIEDDKQIIEQMQRDLRNRKENIEPVANEIKEIIRHSKPNLVIHLDQPTPSGFLTGYVYYLENNEIKRSTLNRPLPGGGKG